MTVILIARIALVFLAALSVLVLFVVILRKRKAYSRKSESLISPRAGSQTSLLPETISQQVTEAPATPQPVSIKPAQIVIGENQNEPAVKITMSDSNVDVRRAKPLDPQSDTVNRLASLFQAVPSILTATEAHGKKLMEVVIDGTLVRAKGGNGFRAFALDSTGRISENATLFDSANLQNMINAAAIWQVASVIVAQKHLADISKKLDEIKDGVEKVHRFLNNKRKSRVISTIKYLSQAYQALEAGELSNSVRQQLEICERDMLEIQNHLLMEYDQKVKEQSKNKKKIGSKAFARDISGKIEDLDLLTEDLSLCLNTRIAAWHILALYPGEPELKDARRADIQRSIESYRSLMSSADILTQEIEEIHSYFNREDTLEERKLELHSKNIESIQLLEEKSEQCMNAVQRSEQLIKSGDAPTRVLLKYEQGVLVEAWEQQEAEA